MGRGYASTGSTGTTARSAARPGFSISSQARKLITNSNSNHGRRPLYLSTAIPGSYPAASFHSSTCERIA